MKHASSYHPPHPWPTILIIALLALALQSCHHDEPVQPNDPEVLPASRTILVYIVASNNLGTGSFDASDISEMQSAARDGQLGNGRLVLYHATDTGITLKEVTAEGIDTLKVYDQTALSVSVDRMRQAISDTKQLAPANDYGLVLWSHATGWLQDGIDEPQTNGYRSFGSDGLTTRYKMNITSLKTALTDASLSFIYFDCCYMGSVEVMYEMRDCAAYMVGSATEDPADGMPYHLNLKNLFDVSITVEEAMIRAAKTTFDYYNDVYKRGDCPCSMAVVRSDQIKPLADVTKQVYSQATMTYNIEYNYQKFKSSGACYYYDLDQYVESICEDPALLSRWREALDKAVLYAAATPYIWSSIPVERHCGLSTYILTSVSSITISNYNTLSWYADVASSLIN